MRQLQKTKASIALSVLAILSKTVYSQNIIYSDGFMQRLSETEAQMRDDGFTGDLLPGHECTRSCEDGEEPRYCYYSFRVEMFPVPNKACESCRPNITNQLSGHPQCECITGDGVERTALTTNRMIPGPGVQVCKGDKMIIDLENDAEGFEITMHWHGAFQKDYQYYDGVPFLTQCPVLSGNTFRYQFAADNAGTLFYHSHVATHMADGQFGAFIVREPPSEEPNIMLYDEDSPQHVIVLNDWFHEMSVDRYPGALEHNRGQSAENFLVNGKGIYTGDKRKTLFTPTLETFPVEIGKRYRFRLIFSLTTVCLVQVSIEDHPVTIIAVDGFHIEPVVADVVTGAAGERVDFIVNASNTDRCYWITFRGLGECRDTKTMQYAVLQYPGCSTIDLANKPAYDDKPLSTGVTRVFNPLYAKTCEASDGEICLTNLQSLEPVDPNLFKVQADYSIVMPFWFFNFSSNGEKDLFKAGSFKKFYVPPVDHLVSLLSNISYSSPSSPPLSQPEARETMCSGRDAAKCREKPCYCANHHAVSLNAVVDLIVIDSVPLADLNHPFHLHGYGFHVLAIETIGRNFTKSDIDALMAKHRRKVDEGSYNERSPKKDTVVVPEGGYVILRFLADNPGWWFFHCHFEWHTATGMNTVINVGTDDDLPPVPDYFPWCGSWTPAPNFYYR